MRTPYDKPEGVLSVLAALLQQMEVTLTSGRLQALMAVVECDGFVCFHYAGYILAAVLYAIY